MILELKKIKSLMFPLFPNYLPWSDGTRYHDLSFLNVEFQDSFFIFPLFLSSRASSVPLHFWPLLWYHLHIWGCWYFSQWSWLLLVIHSAHMMYSAHKLNKQGDNIQPWCSPFPVWNQSIVSSSSNCCFLTGIQVSQEAGKEVWYSHLFKNFPVCCHPHSQRL